MALSAKGAAGAQSVTISQVNFNGSFGESDTCAGIATLATQSNGGGSASFLVTAGANGSCDATFTGGARKTADLPIAVALPGKVLLSPGSLQFANTGTAYAQTVSVSQSNYGGGFTESNTCSGIAKVAAKSNAGGSALYRVTPKSNGSCAATFTGGGARHRALPIVVSTPAPTPAPTPTPQGDDPLLYVGKLATWTQRGILSVADRDQNGTERTQHSATGYGPWSLTPTFTLTVGIPKASISVEMSVNWGSCYGAYNQYCQSNPTVTTSDFDYERSDGYAYGEYAIQGVRIYDSASQQWLTPDAYAGDVSDPMSQKPFMWNNNNPVSYADPSGYCSDPGGSGTRACIDFYIPGATAMTLRGDNRGTTGTARQDRYRVRVNLNFSKHTSSINVARSHYINGASAGMGHNNGSSVVWRGNTAHVHVEASCGNCNALGDAMGFQIRGDFDVTEGKRGAAINGTRSSFPAMEMYTYTQNGVRQDADESASPLGVFGLPITTNANNTKTNPR